MVCRSETSLISEHHQVQDRCLLVQVNGPVLTENSAPEFRALKVYLGHIPIWMDAYIHEVNFGNIHVICI